jgi:hypothetical protein
LAWLDRSNYSPSRIVENSLGGTPALLGALALVTYQQNKSRARSDKNESWSSARGGLAFIMAGKGGRFDRAAHCPLMIVPMKRGILSIDPGAGKYPIPSIRFPPIVVSLHNLHVSADLSEPLIRLRLARKSRHVNHSRSLVGSLRPPVP